MIDEQAARVLADAEVARWSAADATARASVGLAADPDSEVVVWKAEEHSRAWIFHYATRRWLRTRAFSDTTVGASPIVVDRTTGELHVYGSAPPEHAKFVALLDGSL